MEPEVREFLKRIMFTIFSGVLWLALNTAFGIMYGYAFPENKISIGNILFYIFLVGSFIFLIWFYLRLWKNDFEEKV